MSFIRTAAVVAALFAAVPAAAQPGAAPDSLAIARKYAEWFLTGQKDSLWAHSNTATKQQTSADEYVKSLEQLTAQVGTEVKVMEEKFVKRNGRTQYWRTATYTNASEPIMVRFVLDRDMLIGGMGMNPASQAPPVDPIKP